MYRGIPVRGLEMGEEEEKEEEEEEGRECSSAIEMTESGVASATGGGTEIEAAISKAKILDLDLTAHNGLRGLCAVWIMLTQLLLFSELGLDLQGSSIVPVFFVLSGFTHTHVYGRTWGKDDPQRNSRFLFHRLARVMPVYALTNAVAAVLWPLGLLGVNPNDMHTFTWWVAATACNFSTLFSFTLGANLNGPSWTVSTLLVIWTMFPYMLMRVKRFAHHQNIVGELVMSFWLQLVLLLVSFFSILSMGGSFWHASCTATMNPLTRFPLFYMGVCAAELVTRSRQLGIHGLVWPHTSCMFIPYESKRQNGFEGEVSPHGMGSGPDAVPPQAYNDKLALRLLTTTLAVPLLWNAFVGDSTLGGVLLQAIVPFVYISLIAGLTRECDSPGARSMTYQALTTRAAQFLGSISLTLYLVHWPIIFLYIYAIRGAAVWPDCDIASMESGECEALMVAFDAHRCLPLSGVAAVAAISIAVAAALNKTFEEPLREQIWKGWKQIKSNTITVKRERRRITKT